MVLDCKCWIVIKKNHRRIATQLSSLKLLLQQPPDHIISRTLPNKNPKPKPQHLVITHYTALFATWFGKYSRLPPHLSCLYCVRNNYSYNACFLLGTHTPSWVKSIEISEKAMRFAGFMPSVPFECFSKGTGTENGQQYFPPWQFWLWACCIFFTVFYVLPPCAEGN